MKTLKLDESNNLVFNRGNMPLITGTEAVIQRVGNVLSYFYGEWFLDRNNGTPWYEVVFVKPYNANLIITVLKERILSVEGVDKITSFSLDSIDPSTRQLTITFTASTIYGDISSNNTVNLRSY